MNSKAKSKEVSKGLKSASDQPVVATLSHFSTAVVANLLERFPEGVEMYSKETHAPVGMLLTCDEYHHLRFICEKASSLAGIMELVSYFAPVNSDEFTKLGEFLSSRQCVKNAA